MNSAYTQTPISSVNNYLNTLYKLRCQKINLYFNRTCRRKNIKPKYINVIMKNKSKAAMMAKEKAEKLWLSNEIKAQYTAINNLSMKLYNIHLQIASEFHYIEYMEILKHVDLKVEKRLRTKRKTIKNKLKRLLENQRNKFNNDVLEPKTTHKFYNRLENHTDIVFDQNEILLLQKGLKYNTTPYNSNKNFNKHVLNIENAITKTNLEHQTDIRTLIVDKIKDVNQTPLNICRENKIIHQIMRKITQKDAIIAKADKGNTTVIMNIDDYNTKVNEYINNNDIQELNNDPTDLYHKKIKEVINKSIRLMDNREIRSSKMIKPTAPLLRGMPKIHKPNMPIRPVINFTSAPTYKISKFVNKWLCNNIKFEKDYSIKNNIELVNKIEGIDIPTNGKLVSFDVTNMYSNIPVEVTISITKKLLLKNTIDTTIVDDVMKLLEEITKQNYFKFNDKFYIQTDGLPMGSPLSGTLANIYLNDFENLHILNNKNILYKSIKYWHRYVDDILFLFTGTNRQLDQLLNYVNNIHPKIKFTLEVEQRNRINFLDLTIIKNIDRKHQFKIFRKPTQTDQTIDHKSNHPYQHKMASYNHMINRLNNIPMALPDYLEELNIIRYIASRNGYKPTMIDQMNTTHVNKIKYRSYTTLDFDENTTNKYISVEYNRYTSHNIKTIFRNFGYKIAFKTQHKLESELKTRNNQSLDTGVYKLNCSDCPAFYIGQTGRSFVHRFKEHIRDIGKMYPESRFALHINSTQHNYIDINNNMEILYKMRKGDAMDRMEELTIYKHRKNRNLLNNKINSNSNKLYDLIINNN